MRLFFGLHTGSTAQLQIDLPGFRYLPDVGVHRAAAAAHGPGSRPHPPVGVVPEGDAVPAAVPGLGGGIVLLAAVGVDCDRQGSGTFQLPDEVLHKLGRCAVDANHPQVGVVLGEGGGAVGDPVPLMDVAAVPAGEADPVVGSQFLGDVRLDEGLVKGGLGLQQQQVGPGLPENLHAAAVEVPEDIVTD